MYLHGYVTHVEDLWTPATDYNEIWQKSSVVYVKYRTSQLKHVVV